MVVRLAARSARRRSGRIATTALAVALAAAFAVAGFGVAAQMERLIEGTRDAAGSLEALPEGSLVITSSAAGATEPTALSAALVARAGSVDGVLTAGGTYEQPIAVQIPRGSQDDRPPAFRGLVFTSAWDPARWRIVAGSGPPTDRAAGGLPIALDAGGLVTAGARVGDEVRLQTPIGAVDALVTAEVAPTGAPRADGVPGIGDAHVVIAATALPDLLGARDRVDRITVVPRPGVTPSELADRLRAVLPEGLRYISASDPDVLQARAVSAVSGGIASATWAFAVLSALVAGVLVANTFSIVIEQRTEELALARCLGLTRLQTTASFLAEAACIGAVAAVLGVVVGVPLAMAASAVLQPDAVIHPILTRTMVAAGVVVGLGVTSAAALLPAWRAARVAPTQGLQSSTARRHHRGPSLLVLSPLLATVAALGRRSHIVRMAVATPRHDPRRAGATVSTLCIGLALMAMVLTLGASIRGSVADQFSTTSDASLFIRRRGVVRVDAAALERRLGLGERRVDFVDVTTVDGSIRGPGGREPSITSVDAGASTRVVDPDVVAGDVADLSGGVMVSEASATRLGVGVGDSVELRSTSGDVLDLPVRGLYRNTAFYGPAFVDRSAAERIDAVGTFDRAAISLPADAPVPRIRRAIDRRLAGFNRLGVDTPAAFAAVDTDIADTVTRLALVLLSGSVLLGGLGAANNVALSVMERRREFALLRVIGAGRRQIHDLVLTESVILCGLAGILGAAIGTAAGVLGVRLAPPQFAAHAQVPWTSLGLITVGAIAIGAIAAAVPARVAVRREALTDLDAP